MLYVRRLDFRRFLESSLLSSPKFGEGCGLLSRTAAGNRAYMYVALCVAFCQDIHDANITTITTTHPLFVDRYGYVDQGLVNLLLKLTAENERSDANGTMSPVENPAAVDK